VWGRLGGGGLLRCGLFSSHLRRLPCRGLTLREIGLCPRYGTTKLGLAGGGGPFSCLQPSQAQVNVRDRGGLAPRAGRAGDVIRGRRRCYGDRAAGGHHRCTGDRNEAEGTSHAGSSF
jgi:hypothetical protein